MGGTITATELTIANSANQNSILDNWPFPNSQQTVYYPYQQIVYPQTVCSGDVHVFPCPHCDKCKCGKATVKRDKK